MDELLRPLTRLFTFPQQWMVLVKLAGAYVCMSIALGLLGYGPGGLEAIWARRWPSTSPALKGRRVSTQTVQMRVTDVAVHVLAAVHLAKVYCILRVARIPADEATMICAVVGVVGVGSYFALNRPPT